MEENVEQEPNTWGIPRIGDLAPAIVMFNSGRSTTPVPSSQVIELRCDVTPSAIIPIGG